jgi:hypothetical protein
MSNKEKTTCWILTREHNAYDQYGSYFIAVFSRKPTHTELAKVLSKEGYGGGSDVMAALVFLEHILMGGGRQEWEDTWFNLDEITFSEKQK